MRDILREEGIGLATRAEVQRVEPCAKGLTVIARVGGTERRFEAERLLVAAGRITNTDALGLDKVGVELDERGFVQVDAYLRTNVPHVWAAGDVIGQHTDSQLATPVGAHDGGVVASNAGPARCDKWTTASSPAPSLLTRRCQWWG